jgi:hypothetical protein
LGADPKSGEQIAGGIHAVLVEPLHHDEEREHEHHGEAGRGDHAAEHGDADRLARAGAGTGRDYERRDAEDEGKRRHQDRPQAIPRRLDRRLEDRLALDQPPFARHGEAERVRRFSVDDQPE